MFGYGLNRGLYFGSHISQFESSNVTWWGLHCRYLFPSGIITARKGGEYTKESAANHYCTLFYN